MEAREKIYAYIPDDDKVGTASTQKGFPHQFVTTEYIRTDAFIEKACKWLKSNLYDYAGEDDKRNIVPFDDAIFKDFKKAMEE